MSNRRDFLKQLGLTTAAIALWTPTLLSEPIVHFIVPISIREQGMRRLALLRVGTTFDVIKGLRLGAKAFKDKPDEAFYLLGVEGYPTNEGGTFEIGIYANPAQDKLGIVHKTSSDVFFICEDVDHVEPNNAIAKLYHLKRSK